MHAAQIVTCNLDIRVKQLTDFKKVAPHMKVLFSFFPSSLPLVASNTWNKGSSQWFISDVGIEPRVISFVRLLWQKFQVTEKACSISLVLDNWRMWAILKIPSISSSFYWICKHVHAEKKKTTKNKQWNHNCGILVPSRIGNQNNTL